MSEIEMSETRSYVAWAESMEQRYNAKADQRHPTHPSLPSIHRVPDGIRAADKGAYEPKMLSIGPYHRSNQKLQAMEHHKWRYLQAILQQDSTGRGLSDYLKEMEELEKIARSFYSENIELKNDGEFVEMMLLDSCFILQLFLNVEEHGAKDVKKHGAKDDDPIFRTNWILPVISLDMLLLENQLPFLVLERTFRLFTGKATDALVKLALEVFSCLMPINHREISPEDPVPYLHLLHLCHSHLRPSHVYYSKQHCIDLARMDECTPISIPSAKEIVYSGIKFKRLKTYSSILEINFNCVHQVLEIPPIYINHNTNSVFRNLIALEQCYPICGTYFTSYAFFMDCLIDSPQDVENLKSHTIIKHGLANDEEVALFFKKMCIGAVLISRASFLRDIVADVMQCTTRRWNRWRARLMHDYFKDPWSTINLQFTITTIIFTVVQTALAVLSYARHS